MKRDQYIQELTALKDQIRKDATIGPSDYQRQLNKAASRVEALTPAEKIAPEIRPVIASFRQALTSFYSDNSNRGWAQQFALQDIQKLEELLSAKGE